MALKEGEQEDLRTLEERVRAWAETPEATETIRNLYTQDKIMSRELKEKFRVDPNDPAWKEPLS